MSEKSICRFCFLQRAAVNPKTKKPPLTFEGSRGRSWIDVTLCNAPLLDNIFKWKVDMEVTSSDHNSISFSLYTGINPSSLKRKNRTRLENLDLAAFRSFLHNSVGKWESPSLLTRTDIDKEIEQLHEAIASACRDSRLKQTKLSKKEPWWTRSLEIQRSDARRAQRKYYSAKDERDRGYLRQKWKKAEAIYTRALNLAKRNHWAEICERVTPEEPFGTHFEVAKNPDRRHFQLSSTLKENGLTTETPEETIEALLEFHFPSDIGDTDPAHADIRNSSKIPPATQDDPPFTMAEIEEAFKSLNNRKAPGPDGFHANIIKEVFSSNQCYFLSLFNDCLRIGHFPSRWKRAHVIMFHKLNKKDTDPSSLRPICLLDFLGKALDKMITQRLFHHLLSNNHLHQQQYGFTPGRCATDAIIQLKNWINAAREQEQHSVIVSLDIKSAFSRVWWPLVLHKLKGYDCPKNLFLMVASFLCDRRVSMDYGSLSVTRSYTIGCPQGSNSGPLYWLLIANDALKLQLERDTKILAYADDFYLFTAATGKHSQGKGSPSDGNPAEME
ncbi:Retrovirus-related Pol polyprotein from type-1 retrotransposable element R1 [Araneus ventricosus]|uniref:Retrovirus-related Pol polyprotein from type-1 retrotransposable element R1 n=1 Tax=Araneus ventricosus TaxID=182803 RepID=A0A4Y2QY70_ARAVE|nr:Retrovirus-related Pol polyprotein from type-1 retrotransposable element R1 [Araneus ventricosus]